MSLPSRAAAGLLAAGLVLAAGCGEGDAEARIAELEAQLAALSTTSTADPPPPGDLCAGETAQGWLDMHDGRFDDREEERGLLPFASDPYDSLMALHRDYEKPPALIDEGRGCWIQDLFSQFATYDADGYKRDSTFWLEEVVVCSEGGREASARWRVKIGDISTSPPFDLTDLYEECRLRIPAR